ncbi:Transposon Tf2-6 polyprotein, partial [Podosphaera aphanis]
MSDAELEALREYLRENLEKGFIETSTSSFASPVLFVKKPGGGLRFCVDYRALNAITKKNLYPLPRIDDSLRQLLKARKFTRLDLRGAYNQIRIKSGDEPKTAFRTRYGLYQYNVMPFGLTNAPATCQQFVNDVLREFLDIFVVVYLDDILIYSEDPAQHDNHVRKVLEKLEEYGLFCKPEKCEFGVSSTTFLGFVISKHGLSMDTSKIQTIRDWKPPINVRGVQSFLGFANFYRRFISKYSELAAPLFALTRKDTKFQWSQACQSAFDKLKIAFTSEPILRHFDPSLSTVLETDASDKVISAVLSQYHSDSNSIKRLHPVAYFSRTMTSAEINYTVGDKELLAIVESLKEYRQYVCNLSTPVRIITDHQNLTAFTTKRILNRRQARWALELAEIDFCLKFRPGLKNSRADALTRRAEHINLKEGFEAPHDLIVTPGKIISKETSSTVINSSLFCLSREIGEHDPILNLENSFAKEVVDSLNSDLFGQEIIHALKSSLSHHPRVDLGSCKISSQGLLLILEKIYVPESLRTRVISTSHDHPAAGHPGRAKTFELISR